MVVWGLVLIAIGVGVLFDVSIWPVVLIAIGVSVLLSVYFRGNQQAAQWFNCWQCWPNFAQTGRQHDDDQDRTGRRQA